MKYKKLLFWLVFIFAVLIRCIMFGAVPAGLNQDEAFAGYEAYSLLKYGIDSHGYKNPVYFVSWGSGMNVLASYLMIPFVKIFGANEFAIRLPQLILSVLTLPAFYFVLKKTAGEKTALLGLFLLAISPWHIMLSKWGLESNLAPALLIFGMLFFIKGAENNRWFILSALFYGLSLYAYATAWIFVPAVLLVSLAYVLKYKKIKSVKCVILSGTMFFAIALPLVLFVLVNLNVINEIRMPLFSVPKLVYMRTGEISLLNIFKADTYKNLFSVLFLGRDGNFWNSAGETGIYYFLSAPLTVLGIINCLRKKYSPKAFILINFIVAIFVSLIMWGVNINKINFIHLPIIALTAIGAKYILKNKLVATAFLCGYITLFGVFTNYYYKDYAKTFSYYGCSGLSGAMEKAKGLSGRIYVDSFIEYPLVLFYSGQDTREYVNTKKYINYPSAYMYPESFGRYIFTDDFKNIDENSAYITRKQYSQNFKDKGFVVCEYENIIICYKTGT